MKGNRVKWLVILLWLSVILLTGISQSFSKSLSDILEEAKVRYADFNKDFKDIAIIFDSKIYGPDGEMVSEMKLFLKGEKSRSETLIQIPETAGMPEGMGIMLVIAIFDGQDTWMISPFTGKTKLTTEQAEEQMYYQTGMNWWKFISNKTKYVGTEKVNDIECYLFELEIERKSPYKRIWVDKDRLFLIQAEGKNSSGDNIRTIFSDFRKVKGNWEFPYKVEAFINEKLMITVLVKSFEMNQGLSDELFDVDKVEIEGPNLQEMMQNLMQQGKNN